VQLVVRSDSAAYQPLSDLPKETVLRADGRVLWRQAENIDADLATGDIEIQVDEIEVLGTCDPLPFSVFPEEKVNEEARLTYRFLDLRRQRDVWPRRCS
jgi:aspartyl-tRNA synthetase